MANNPQPRQFVQFNEERHRQRREYEILEARKKLNEQFYVTPKCCFPNVEYEEWIQKYTDNLVKYFRKTTLTAQLNVKNNAEQITLLYKAGYWPYNAALEITEQHEKTFANG